jgi:glucokinase
MSVITRLERHIGLAETTLNGVIDSTATYEIAENVLIIRTSTHDTIHITQGIGKKLVDIINNELFRDSFKSKG